MFMMTAVCLIHATLAAPRVEIHQDNVEIRESCTVAVPLGAVIADADGNGVVHITGENITVDFAGAVLRGAPANTADDTLTGAGIRITGRGVVLRGAIVAGFKAGIHASSADGL